MPPTGDVVDRLRETCGQVTGPDGVGTAYLIAPRRMATALHVVKSWKDGEQYRVAFGAQNSSLRVRVLKRDAVTDAAILELEDEVAAPPLPITEELLRKSPWEAFGFPGLAGRAGGGVTGVSISGHVQDSNARDDDGHPALLLFSAMAAAGNASPLHGFSGSPILVDGAVVGHLTKHLGDPDDRRRAAYGLVYACPVRAVRALLDVQPALIGITPLDIPVLADAIPDIDASSYHVFLSYRSTNRAWAMSLVSRLEGAGLRVFIDQKELEPGLPLAAQLDSALARSRAAVVLVTKEWLESRWCQAEASVLLKRAVEDRRFRLIPVRLDASPMPPSLDSLLWLDFNGTARAEGPTLERLMYSLVGRHPPTANSPEGQVAAAEVSVVDGFVQKVRAAASNDPQRVRPILDAWRQVGSSDVAPLVAAAEVFVGQNRPDLAVGVLQGAPQTLRVRQLEAFALRKSGRMDEAVERLERLAREGNLDAETGGLLAGSYKSRWQRTGDRAFLWESYRVYRETYERTGNEFNGINAAAMALHAGDQAYRHRTAADVRDKVLAKAGGLDYWEMATLGEAFLLLEQFDDAREWYRKAAGAAAGRHQDIAVMRRQARLNLVALGQPRDRLDSALPVPRVLAYFGHMVDAPDRAEPRFRREKVGAVRQAIRERLDALGPLYGFGTAARGSDILFLESLLERDLGATVILPFPIADFVALSMGGVWTQRFTAIQSNPRVEIQVLKDSRPPDPDLPQAFTDANMEVQRRAVDYARRLDETPAVIAVWNRERGDGPGGTSDAMALWEDEGYTVDVIDITKL